MIGDENVRRKPKNEADLRKEFGDDLVDRAIEVKNVDQNNPHPLWCTETFCILYRSFSRTPRVSAAERASKLKTYQLNAWRRTYPEVDDFINSARDEGIGIIEDALFRQAERGNVNAQLGILKAYQPERYGTKITATTTQTSPPGQSYDLSKLTSDEVRQLEALSSKALVGTTESIPNEHNPLVQRALENKSND